MTFPNVPDAPGVPPLVRNPLATFNAVTLLAADALLLFKGLSGFKRWGIYSGSNPVVIADTVVAFHFKQDYEVLDYPVQNGGFQSFNKVQVPWDAVFRFSSGGSEENRAALLASIINIVGDTTLYEVVTPEVTYRNANVVGYDYKREARDGAGLIIVDVKLKHVRVSATAAFTQNTPSSVASAAPIPSTPLPASQVASPTAADPVSVGQVQAGVSGPPPAVSFANLGGFQ